MTDLKHIVIEDKPYLVEEPVWNVYLSLSHEAELSRGVLPCDVAVGSVRFREGVKVATMLRSISRRQEGKG